MKTSLLLIILIVLNTTAIISEPVTNLIEGVNSWWFLGLELALLIGFYLNKIVKDLRTHCEIDCNNLKLYVVKATKV